MKTENELNEEILQTTLEINNYYPALSKYLAEMEVTIPNEGNPEITLQSLEAYNNSLNSMIDKFIIASSENKCNEK